MCRLLYCISFQVYYGNSSGPNGKTLSSVASSNLGSIYNSGPMSSTMSQPSSVGSVAMPIYTSAGGMPVYTSSGSIGVPPPGGGALMPLVPPSGQYPPAYLYPLLSTPGSTHAYHISPGYPAQHAPRSINFYHIPQMAHLRATPPHPGAPVNSCGSRGGSSSSSSSSSGSSTRGFGKGHHQGGHSHVKASSRSSDSSPNSSQYSSPPQTPSPDHTRDNHLDKRGKN